MSGTSITAVDRQTQLASALARLAELLRQDVGDRSSSVAAVDEVLEQGPLAHVAAVFGLSVFERRVLLLAAAVELDGEIARLVAQAQDGTDPLPTFGLAFVLFPDAHWDALAPGSPLRHWRLVELGVGPTLASRPLLVDESVLHGLTGVPATDRRLMGIVRSCPALPLAPSHHEIGRRLGELLADVASPTLVRLEGDDINARLGVALALASALGRRALVVRGPALPPPGGELARLAVLVGRDALLADAVVVMEGEGAPASTLAAFVDELVVTTAVLVGGPPVIVAGRVPFVRAVDPPGPAEQRAMWGEHRLPGGSEMETAVAWASQHHRLDVGTLDAIAAEVAALPDGAPCADRFVQLCRERSRVPLDGLAVRVEPTAIWDDLVLPSAHADLLHAIARQARHRATVHEQWGFAARSSRGLGVTALFAGESGTGKTFAAEVIAADLGLDLYRIDLSAVVSKYIGETEKHLRRVFDAGEASGAVLLFDEADALFGKRSEVKDSHDRYANVEVAYLLQRMEHYRGLAVLTTNLRSSLDQAFLRRLRFVVQFPFPDVHARAELWRRAFPPAAPLAGVDPDRLARLPIPGGTIASIALAAAFAAAGDGDGGPITPDHIRSAVRAEYAKSDRSMTRLEDEVLG